MKYLFAVIFLMAVLNSCNHVTVDSDTGSVEVDGIEHTQIKPNIIFILTDDQGYGDVSALNPDAKFETPQLDSLAASGMIFTDAHSLICDSNLDMPVIGSAVQLDRSARARVLAGIGQQVGDDLR